VIEATNNIKSYKNNVEKYRKSERAHRGTHAAMGHEIYGHDLSARPFVRDDRESQSLRTDLTDFAGGSRGERPADVARITKSQRDPCALSRRKKKGIPRDCPMQFVVHRVIRVLVSHLLYDAPEPPSSGKTSHRIVNVIAPFVRDFFAVCSRGNFSTVKREPRGAAKVIIISIENCTARLSVTLDAKSRLSQPCLRGS